jgi:transketolase
MFKMRDEFSKVMCEIAEKDKDVMLIVGDYGHQLVDSYGKQFPSQYLNLGICEQSIIGIAAGMALEGIKPYVHTITPFLIERPFEQIKLDIDQQNVNVKLIGFADYPKGGPSHTEIDAEKLMSLFKNIKSYFPKDSNETRAALLEAHSLNSPCFISLKKDTTKNG